MLRKLSCNNNNDNNNNNNNTTTTTNNNNNNNNSNNRHLEWLAKKNLQDIYTLIRETFSRETNKFCDFWPFSKSMSCETFKTAIPKSLSCILFSIFHSCHFISNLEFPKVPNFYGNSYLSYFR